MADQGQNFQQIKRDSSKEVQKINLGWKGYVPGYRNRVVRDINTQIEDQSSAYSRRINELPGGPIKSPGALREETKTPSTPLQEMAIAQQAAQEAAFLEEADYANQLALEQEELYVAQAAQEEANELLEEGRSFGRPSAIKYLCILFILTLPNDLIDLAQLVGWLPQTLWITVLVWFVSLAISVITIFVFWFTDTQYKNAKNYAKNLEKRAMAITANLTRLEGQAIQGARAMGKVPGMAKAGARLEKSVGKIATKVAGNPTMKAIYGAVVEFAPFISIAPWSSISLIWSYLDDRKARKIARESAEEAYKQLSQSAAEVV